MQPLNVTPHSPDFQNNTAANQSLTALLRKTALADKDNACPAENAALADNQDSSKAPDASPKVQVNTFNLDQLTQARVFELGIDVSLYEQLQEQARNTVDGTNAFPFFTQITPEDFKGGIPKVPENTYDEEVVHLYLQATDDTPVPDCICECGNQLSPETTTPRGYSPITITDYYAGSVTHCHIMQKRYRCSHCGRLHIVPPIFKHPKHEVTFRLLFLAQKTMLAASMQHCSRITGLDLKLLETIRRAYLISSFEEPSIQSLTEVRRIGIDEHSIFRRHKYCTVIYDLDSRKLLYVCEGKKQEDILPFFKRLKELGIDKQIEYVSCDCASGFIGMVKSSLPKTKIVLDFFHIIRDFGKVVDIVRKRAHAINDVKISLVKAVLEEKRLFELYTEANTEAYLAKKQKDQLKYEASMTLVGIYKRERDKQKDTVQRLSVRLATDIQDNQLVDQRNQNDATAIVNTLMAQASHELLEQLLHDKEILKSARFYIGRGLSKIKEIATSESDKYKDTGAQQFARDFLELSKQIPVIALVLQLGDDMRLIWKGNLTPEQCSQHLEAMKDSADKLGHDSISKFFKSLLSKKEYLVYAGTARVSNSIVEGCNSSAKWCQRITRGVKNVAMYFLGLHVMHSGNQGLTSSSL